MSEPSGFTCTSIFSIGEIFKVCGIRVTKKHIYLLFQWNKILMLEVSKKADVFSWKVNRYNILIQYMPKAGNFL